MINFVFRAYIKIEQSYALCHLLSLKNAILNQLKTLKAGILLHTNTSFNKYQRNFKESF